MKGTTPRILSFLMALALLASTFAMVAGPSRDAEAATNNTFDAVNPALSRSFATAAGDNFPLYIAISPTYAADKTIYAVVSINGSTNGDLANTKIVRSTDGGMSWNNGLNPLTSLTGTGTHKVRGLQVAPNGTLVLLVTTGAAAAPGQLYRSTDGGSTWTVHSQSGAGAAVATAANVPAPGAAGGDPAGFAVSPNFASNGQVLVAQVNGTVARYDQNRAAWEALDFTGICGANPVLAVEFHPNYASNEELWAVCNTAAPSVRVGRQERLSAAATVGGALDGANTWNGARIKFDRSNVIYVGGRRADNTNGNIFELVGTTWTARGSGLGGGALGSKGAVGDFAIVSGTGTTARIVATYFDPATAAAAGAANTQVTRDGGTTWAKPNKEPTDIRGGTGAMYRPVAVGPDGTVWVGSPHGAAGNLGGLYAGKFIGTDFGFAAMGLTTTVFAGPITDVIASPNYGSDSTVGLINAEGLWVSNNLGPSTTAADVGWRLAYPATDLVSATFSKNYASDRSVYVVNSKSSGNKGYRSFDGGVIWEVMKTTRDDGFPADAAVFRKIISGGSGILYAITDDSANPFAASTNHGDNWASKGPANGLNTSDARDVDAAGATVAVGARSGGTIQVFVSKDSGATFTRVGTRNMGGAAADVRVFVSPNYATDGVVIAGTRDDTVGRVEVSYGDLYRSTKDADWVRIDTLAHISQGLADESTNVLAVAGVIGKANRLYALTTQVAGATTGSPRAMSNFVTATSSGSFRGPCASAAVGTATNTFSVATGAGCTAPAGALGSTAGSRIAVGGGENPVLFVALGAAGWLARITDLGVNVPTLTEPADGRGFTETPTGAGVYNGIVLKWSSVSGMDASSSYEVNVSEDPAFPLFGSVIRGRVMVMGNTTSWTYTSGGPDVAMPTLERGKKYYWRVRVGDGIYSAVRSFNYDMLRPILSRPDNGTEVNSLRPFFAWKSTGIGAAGTETDIEADRMAFEISTDVTFPKDKTKRVEFESLALSWEPDADLIPNTTYYWRVQGGKLRTDAKGVTSTIWGAFGGPFSLRTPPGAVRPPTPPPGPAVALKVEDAFKPIVADVVIVWFFNAKTQSWAKYDPKAPAFANTLTEIQPDDVVLIIAAKDITGFKLGSRTYDLVKGNNYKAYIP